MALNKAYDKYRESAITTSGPEELTLMLYNGLIRFITQAQRAIADQNVAKAHDHIIRAQDIIAEFIATLDHKYEISANLEQLYDYMNRRLVEANLKKDQEILAEVLRLATDLRDTWVQAMKIARQGTTDYPQAK